jgi:hypothetical protein
VGHVSNTFLDILTMPAKDYGPVTEIQLDERAEDLCRWFSLIIELEVNIRPDPSIKPDTSIDKKRADGMYARLLYRFVGV